MQKFSDYLISESNRLIEINMSGSSLSALTKDISATVGIEFEMCIPLGGSTATQSTKHQFPKCESFSDIEQYFLSSGTPDTAVARVLKSIRAEFKRYLIDDVAPDMWETVERSEIKKFVKANYDRSEWLDMFHELLDEQPAEYTDAYDDWLARFIKEDGAAHEYTFIRHIKEWDTMQDVYREYSNDLKIPSDPETATELEIQQLGASFAKTIRRPVKVDFSYHNAKRDKVSYVMEADSSIIPDSEADCGVELVSPPIPLEDILSELKTVYRWAHSVKAYTNESTGLHINVGLQNYSRAKLDFVKLALLVGDQYVLSQYNRASNEYAVSAVALLKSNLSQSADKVMDALNKMRTSLDNWAAKELHSGTTHKHTSINTKTGYIEFRSPGGNWLDLSPSMIIETVMRFVVAMDAAMDPNKYRQEYLKKLYALVDSSRSSTEGDITKLFAQYATGSLSSADLKQFVQTIRTTRVSKQPSIAK